MLPFKTVDERYAVIKDLALKSGFDFFEVNWETVSEETMLEIMTYGLPVRPRHWHYGQSYDYQKHSGEMGSSKVYELVLNNDPSWAFLLDNNTDVANIMVMCHVIGHSAVFKSNYLFQKTNRKMVYKSAEMAERVDKIIDRHGLEKVEYIMDIGFALEKNIDWHKGQYRNKYAKPTKIQVTVEKSEFWDMLGSSEEDTKELILNKSFPPHIEYDLLWFISQYSNMEDWEKELLEIIREESFYFYPQYCTKIINEGMACIAHVELMNRLTEEGYLSDPEFLDFVNIHEKVVQPGHSKTNINPYYLGYQILTTMKETGASIQDLQKIISEEDDVSFLRNYLTQEICDKLGLFAYEKITDKFGQQYLQITSDRKDKVVEHLVKDLYHYRSPLIGISYADNAIVELEHHSLEYGRLDKKHLQKVLEYVYYCFKNKTVSIETENSVGSKCRYVYDLMGFREMPV